MADRAPAVGIDATPLVSGHATRGIGRHLARSFEAALATDPGWAASELATLVANGQPAPLPGHSWRTRRSRIRPQDLDPFVAAVADRLAIRDSPPRRWHHTDPLIPWAPLSARRTIVSVYDAIPLEDGEVWRSIARHRRVVYRRYLGLARAARGVICSLTSTADTVATTVGIARDRIVVVPPFVHRLASDPDDAGRLEGRDAERRLVYVGTLEPHKRPELAVATVAELARRGILATLDIVDGRPANRRPGLERLAHDLGVASRVRFASRLTDAELDRVYAGSTLLATSRLEGFGQPPIEAILAAGRVVAARIPSYLETVGDIASFATDATPAAFADAVEAAVAPPSDDARQMLAVRFGADAATTALRAAYERFA